MYVHCRFDEGAVFEDPFTPEDVSRRDYFHPSPEGQRGLADVTWAATFDFTDQIPSTSTATTAPVEGGTWVILVAADDVAVAGIEYRLDLGPWQWCADPLVLAAGSNIRFRAVDVNENIDVRVDGLRSVRTAATSALFPARGPRETVRFPTVRRPRAARTTFDPVARKLLLRRGTTVSMRRIRGAFTERT
jgi:hypothetical protein